MFHFYPYKALRDKEVTRHTSLLLSDMRPSMSISGFANVRKVGFAELARTTVLSIPIANKEITVVFVRLSMITLPSNIWA